MANPSYDVVTVADLCVDLILSDADQPVFGQAERLVGDYALELGGSACIFAAQAARLGLRVAVAGVVGDDAFGRWARARLQGCGVDVGWVRVHPEVKTGIGVSLVRGGDRAILTFPGTIDAMSMDDVPPDFLRSARHLHLASFFLLRGMRTGFRELLRDARGLGLSVSLDPNWDPAEAWDGGLLGLLPLVDAFLPNRTELLALTGAAESAEAVASLRSGGVRGRVAAKCGPEGAWLATDERVAICRGAAQDEVDGIGAGDCFDAGFVYGLLSGWSDEAALRAACACGAANVRARGGLAGQLDAGGLAARLMEPGLEVRDAGAW